MGHGITNRHSILAATITLVALSGSGIAQDRPGQGVQSAAQPPIKCTCRYKGQDFHLGEVICLSTSGGPRIAQCEMALNNTSWTITEGPCPTAQAPASPTPILAALDRIAD